MKVRLVLLVIGAGLVLGALVGGLFHLASIPTLLLIGSIGMALLFWHNATVAFQRWMQGTR